ncbi:MAG: hypothetical protein ACLFP4_16110 [Spirochaetales bacterium]
MTKSEEIRLEQEKANEARPFIVAELRSNRALLEIASTVAQQWSIDERKAYRWVHYVSEEFAQRKRRWVTIGLIIVWVGVLIALGGVALTIFADLETLARPWLFGVLLGLPLTFIGAIIIARSAILVCLPV